jgi:hypothetical protein
LRFHHSCWATYRGISGIEGQERGALYREWSPQRVESLRLHAGLNVEQMAAKLEITKEKLIAYLSGHGELGPKPARLVRGLAVDTRFESQEAGEIDWSDRRACFCLCRHCGWQAGELARRLNVLDNTVTAWWDRGVSKWSVRYWSQLNVLARQNGFDAGMLVDDYLWTPELLREAIERFGGSLVEWAQAGGLDTSNLVRQALGGACRINRRMAYHFTLAAIRLRVPLPPKGYIEPKRRARRPFPGGCRGAQGSRLWKPEELALLGTMPDRTVAEKLGNRTVIAVRHMRRKLGLKGVPRWAATPQPASAPLEEVLALYESLHGACIAESSGLAVGTS